MRFILLLFLLISRLSIAQPPAIDSLKSTLNTKISDSLRASTLVRISQTFSENGKYDSSRVYAEKAVKIAEKAALPRLQARACQLAAEAYSDMTNFKKSAEYAFKALKLAESVKDTMYMAQASKEIAFAYLRTNQPEKCREWLNKTVVLFEHLKMDRYVAFCLMTIGNTYHTQGVDSLGFPYFKRALKIAEKVNDEYTTNFILSNYAINLSGAGHVKEAAEIGEKTLPFFVANSLPGEFIGEYVNLCLYHVQLGNYGKAIRYGEQGKKIAYEHKIWGPYKALAVNLTEVYERTGNYKEALENMKLVAMAKDSLSIQEVRDQTETLELKYDAEKKNLEIENLNANLENKRLQQFILIGGLLALSLIGGVFYTSNRSLNKKNQLIETQKAEIEFLNKGLEKKVEERTSELQKALDDIKEAMSRGQKFERKRLASDLHDNLGSVLSAINMNLEALDPKSLTDREKRLYSNIKSMTSDAYQEVRLISHNLSPKELEAEGLEKALIRLTEKLNLAEKTAFTLDYQIPEKLPERLEVNLYAIILELCNNIIRHAKAHTALIKLSGDRTEVNLIIEDDGTGFNPQNGNGHGLRNIETRIAELGGNMDIRSNENAGSSFQIQIPV